MVEWLSMDLLVCHPYIQAVFGGPAEHQAQCYLGDIQVNSMLFRDCV